MKLHKKLLGYFLDHSVHLIIFRQGVHKPGNSGISLNMENLGNSV